jgi:acetyl-CoA carboxylase biotin carboxyl carrier protein
MEHLDLKSVLEILRFVNKSDLTEVELSQPDFKLKIKRRGGDAPYVEYIPAPQVVQAVPQVGAAAAPAPLAAPAAAAPAPAQAAQPTALAPSASHGTGHIVRAPMVGTFYRAGGPDKPAFVQVGDVVRKGQVLCIIEAMKLFNEIESEVEGKVVKILVDNAKPVEYDQPLFEIEVA